LLDSTPTARMVVRGVDPTALLESARDTLKGLKWGTKYRDAKVQWDQVLLNRGSPWLVRIMNRGEKVGWMPNWTDLLPEDFDLVPGVREHMGEQTAFLAARPVEPGVSDFVISVEQSVSGTNQRVFAEKALEAIAKTLESRGVVLDQVHAVKSNQLEEACPLHQVTRVLVAKEAKKLAKGQKKGFFG